MYLSKLSFLAFLLVATTSAWASELQPVQLPQDEATHDFQVEWWYYTGHFQAITDDGVRNFAYEVTVFQGEPVDPVRGYVAHFAFIDLDKKEYHPYQRASPIASRRPPAPKTKGFKFIFDAGQWLIEGKNGQDHLKVSTPKYAMDLTLSASKEASLFGDHGIIDYGETGKLAYYSRTRIKTTGTITLPNAQGKPEKLKIVGTSWMDHQWGDTGNPNRLGWDWFSIQLTNGFDFMMFQVRDTATKEVIKSFGFIVDLEGKVQTIPGEKISIVGSKPYSFGKVSYPMQFDITVAEPFDLSLVVNARFPKQRFKTIGQLTPIYWEGSSKTIGTWKGEAIDGQGFTEMAGYE